jgi:hypothetical protein
MKSTANSLLWTAAGGSSRRFRYNPITAADEKIPLSVVHVNKKPQYLVFSPHSGHLVAKHWQSPVESSKQPFTGRILQPPILPQFLCTRDLRPVISPIQA